jgi:hypothetical protein
MILARMSCKRRDRDELYTYELPGATPQPEEITSAEHRLGSPLPESLKDFYGRCDGWSNFSQDISILPLHLLGSSEAEQRLTFVRIIESETTHDNTIDLDNVAVIGWSQDNEDTILVWLDPGRDGRVVRWWSEDREVYKNFQEYFMAEIEYTNHYFTT